MAISPSELILRQQEIDRKYPGLLTGLPESMTASMGEPAQGMETAGNEPIVATGSRNVPVQSPTINPDDLIPRGINNRDFIDQRDQDLNNGVNAVQHKGLFGVKGTLRDILGFVGDSLLVGSGKDPFYGKTRQRERIGDAMAGFTQDPNGAAERLTAIDPVMAKTVQDLAINEQLKRAQLASTNEYRQSMADSRKFETVNKATNVIARIFASPVAQTNPELAMRQAQQISKQIGIPLEELGVSADITPEEMQMYGARDMTVNQTMQMPYKERMTTVAERGVAAREQDAQSNRIRANRPPAGRAPPTRSISQVDAEVADAVLSGRATPAQQKYYDERIKRAGKGRGTPRPASVAVPAAPPGFKYVKQPKP